MSELAEIKAACDGLGKTFHAFKETLDAERKAGKPSGETALKFEKIEADLLRFEETKTRVEKALVAMQNVEANSKAAGEQKVATYKEKLDTYLRKNHTEGLNEARVAIKAMSALSGPEGGYWLTLPELDPTFHQNFVETSPMDELARTVTITGESLKGRRRASRFATGGWVGEADSRPTTNTGTLGEWQIFAREQYAYPEAPISFLEDAGTDVEGWIQSEVGGEFAVTRATAFVSGNGVKRPMGFNSYSETDPGNGAFIESVDMATSNALAANDLIGLQEMLKEPYQGNATWGFQRATLSLIRKLVTSSQVANYLWQPGLQLGAPSTILGRPYRFFADLPAVSASDSTYPIVYGDFRQAYTIVRRKGISVLRDAVTNKGFVGFYIVERVGGDVVHFEALKRLSNKT